MTQEPKKSRRGVYYDLTESPYEYESPYGDLFKFSSRKKLEIYTRDVEKELDRIDKTFDRTEIKRYLPAEIVQLIYRSVYRGFYNVMRN